MIWSVAKPLQRTCLMFTICGFLSPCICSQFFLKISKIIKYLEEIICYKYFSVHCLNQGAKMSQQRPNVNVFFVAIPQGMAKQ